MHNKLFLIKPMQGEWISVHKKFQKGISHYIPIVYWSHKIYALIYIQTRTTTKTYSESNILLCWIFSHQMRSFSWQDNIFSMQSTWKCQHRWLVDLLEKNKIMPKISNVNVISTIQINYSKNNPRTLLHIVLKKLYKKLRKNYLYENEWTRYVLS